jgi:hypothetical protein
LAERLAREATPENRVAQLYLLLFAREPSADELKTTAEFLTNGGSLSDLCLALLNTNEAIYID